jgi:hypothetical protein
MIYKLRVFWEDKEMGYPDQTIAHTFEHYDLAISEVLHYGFLRGQDLD